MESLIQLALADEHEIFRDGIRAGMKNKDIIRITWEAGNSKDMMKNLKLTTPDVLLMDIRMYEENAVDSLRAIKKEYKQLKIIIYSLYDDIQLVREMMEHGANAYLAKTADANEIYKAIITIIHNDFYFNDLVSAAVLFKLQEKKTVRKFYSERARFNDKELKILKLISEDKTTDEISEQIFLSPRTVETIRQNMKAKAGVKTIVGLVMYAITNKLLK